MPIDLLEDDALDQIKKRMPSFIERFGAQLKATDEGRMNYYEKLGYKPGVTFEGKPSFVDPESGDLYQADPPGFDTGDVADFAGGAARMAIQGVPQAVGTVLGTAGGAAGGPGGAVVGGRIGSGAGAAIGEAASQGVSALLPGDDELSLGERATNVGVAGGLGLGTQVVADKAVDAFRALRPKNVTAGYINRQYAKPYAAESDRVAGEVGQRYTPGQATGSRTLLTVEGMLRRHPATADQVAAFDADQFRRSAKFLDDTLDLISTRKETQESLGGRITGAFDRTIQGAVSARRAAAKADFGQVDQLAGTQKIFTPNNLITEIDDLITKYDVPGGGDASASLVSQLRGLKNTLTKEAGPVTRNTGVLDARGGAITQTEIRPPKELTASETERLLEVYGGASKGVGAVFKDLDTAQQRLIAGRFQSAVMRDVDAAVDQGGAAGKVGLALKTARDNYKANSKAINDLEDSVIGRMMGGQFDRAPERVAEAFSRMRPTELKQTFSLLEKSDPELAQGVKRFLVDDAMQAAGVPRSANVPRGQIGGEDIFSPAKFLTTIRKSSFWDVASDAEKTRLGLAVRDLERVAFRNGTDGSPTAPLMMAFQMMSTSGAGGLAGFATTGDWRGAAAGAIAGGALKPAATAAIQSAIIRKGARLLFDPQGQHALRTVANQSPGSKAYTGAMGYLTSLLGAEMTRADPMGAAPIIPQDGGRDLLADDFAVDGSPPPSASAGLGPATSQQFQTALTPDEEPAFQQWKQRFAPNDSGMDYDLRGAFKAGVTPDPQTGHFPDTFKKPNHPTFSTESQYARPPYAAASRAGRWEGDNFIPSGHVDPQDLRPGDIESPIPTSLLAEGRRRVREQSSGAPNAQGRPQEAGRQTLTQGGDQFAPQGGGLQGQSPQGQGQGATRAAERLPVLETIQEIVGTAPGAEDRIRGAIGRGVTDRELVALAGPMLAGANAAGVSVEGRGKNLRLTLPNGISLALDTDNLARVLRKLFSSPAPQAQPAGAFQ